MAFAQGSRTRLSFITETTYGTTPAGNFTELPFSTHNLSLTKDRVQGSDIQTDRMTRHDRHGNRNAIGDIVFDLRSDNYDAMLESLMFSAWDATPSSAPDELKVGTTIKSFTFEDYLADIDQARLFTGMAVSQAQFSIQPNQMITTTVGFVGQDMSVGSTEKTVTAAALNAPFDSHSGALTLANTGATLIANNAITSIDFTVNNSLSPTFVVGNSSSQQLEYGRAEVEGTITAYFEDLTLVNRFLDEVDTGLKITVNDPSGNNEYGFFFPRVKFNGADAPVANPQSRIITIPFVALYDATAGSNLVITRPDST